MTHSRKGNAMTRKLVMMLFAIALGSSVLTGCNTVRGVGTDIKAAGSELQQEAREHKTY